MNDSAQERAWREGACSLSYAQPLLLPLAVRWVAGTPSWLLTLQRSSEGQLTGGSISYRAFLEGFTLLVL